MFTFKQFLNLNIFDHILPLPKVHPDFLPLFIPPTLSSFSKSKQENLVTTTWKPRGLNTKFLIHNSGLH